MSDMACLRVDVIDHPLVSSRLMDLRNQRHSRSVFRTALRELSSLLVYEAMRDAPTELAPVETPLVETKGRRLVASPLLVPVLRAGLGMVEAAQTLLPDSAVGFVGLARNETTHLPESYMERLPEDLSATPVLVLDPMLATGGSLARCIELLKARSATEITVVCVLAAPEGLARLEALGMPLRIVTAAIDERLNGDAFIVPGLGDAGDRQFGEL